MVMQGMISKVRAGTSLYLDGGGCASGRPSDQSLLAFSLRSLGKASI